MSLRHRLRDRQVAIKTKMSMLAVTTMKIDNGLCSLSLEDKVKHATLSVLTTDQIQSRVARLKVDVQLVLDDSKYMHVSSLATVKYRKTRCSRRCHRAPTKTEPTTTWAT
eukprot:CAMPEP_0115137658 /NCGR_PEP_ID=MMETSP0227-20121206/57197_1 /TAXON_ID=89957 /ORGANISM="Polarella glacialis, Strain CCMP 1383" /LENGTH=109 /DNA_ID=CAMNT_0002545119 /DNA_START=170 /DNA_END=500 /DNA_ORIENTATION=-